MTSLIDLICELSDIPGVSGWEDPVRERIVSLVQEHCDSLHTDALGNLIAFKKGARRPKNKLLLSAHMDEVGFIITHIEEDGLLRFANVGGIDTRVVVEKAVEVGPNRLYGAVGSKALHLHTEKEREEVADLEKLFIDIGARSKEEALEHVQLGDRAIFHAPFLSVGNDCVLGRAFDDRAGCALLVKLLQSDLPWDCHFAFTVQEETGCTGAAAVGYAVNPDIAIAVEATTASDIGGVSGNKRVSCLGKGPVVSYMDNGTVYDSALYRLAFEVAKEEGIPCQTKSLVAGGNESRSLQTAGTGARVMAVSLPCRYIHSPSNMLHKQDVEDTYRLLQALIRKLGNYESA